MHLFESKRTAETVSRPGPNACARTGCMAGCLQAALQRNKAGDRMDAKSASYLRDCRRVLSPNVKRDCV